MTRLDADTIYLAARIHTMDAQTPTATAVAVCGGTILAAGPTAEVMRLAGPATQVVDLGGAILTPGLTDSHCHPLMGVHITRGADLSAARTFEEVAGLLREASARTAAGDWVFAWGLTPDALEGRAPHRALLDELGGGRPLVVRFFDGHSMLAGTEALARAGIAGPRVFDQSAEVVCDEEGRPTGLLNEWEAMDLIDRAAPARSPEETLEALVDLLQSMADAGLTTLHAMDFSGEPYELLTAVEDRGELPLHIEFSPWCAPGDGLERWAAIAGMQGTGGRRWTVSGVKLFLDGTIDNGTAWLETPDVHGASVRSLWPDVGEYSRAVEYFDARGIGTATHAIGDAAVRQVLDTVEAIGSARSGAVHRIEHVETLPDDLIPRFRELGVVASMQPTHCTHFLRADATDNWSLRLGDARADRAWRIRDLREAGIFVALGSDWPIAPFDPCEIMADARLRHRVDGDDRRSILPAQRISARMALEGYTSHAARAGGHPDATGAVVAGRRADLTIFRADPLEVAPEVLADRLVAGTIVEGTLRPRRPASAEPLPEGSLSA